MAITKNAKVEADLVRKVRLIDETLTVLSSDSEEIRHATADNGATLHLILEQLQILNLYMAEMLGDKITSTK